MSSIVLFLLSIQINHGDSAPLANITSNTQNRNSTVSWHSEPNVRGTFSILVSCIVTLSLCVWTALHLNIVGLCVPSMIDSLL